MKRRGMRIAALTVFMAMLLGGCKGSSDPDSLKIKETKKEKTVLTMFLPIDGTGQAVSTYRNAISDYNKAQEEVEIRVDGIATGDGFNEALERRLEEGGEGADLFVVNADRVKDLYAEGYFMDLGSLPVYDQLSESAKMQSKVGDIVYTVPLQMTAYGLYVNVGRLKEFDLEVPKNREEFLHCCQVLKEGGITPIGLNRWYALTTYTMGVGLAPIYQAENKEEILAGLNDGSVKIGDYMVEGFRFFQELVQKGYYGDNITAEETDKIKAGAEGIEKFRNGENVFLASPLGSEKYIDDVDNGEIEFVQTGFPVLSDGSVCIPAAGARLCVNAKGKHAKEAYEAAEYLTTMKFQELARSDSGYPSAITGDKKKEIDERCSDLYEKSLEAGQIPIEDMSLSFTYWDTIRELCLKVIDGMTPEEAAEEYNQIQAAQIEENLS